MELYKYTGSVAVLTVRFGKAETITLYDSYDDSVAPVRLDVRGALAALRKVQDENRIHGNVEVFELRPSPDGAVHLGVSWPSIGTVPPEEAKKFAEEVARAAAAAAAFPYNGYVYTFE